MGIALNENLMQKALLELDLLLPRELTLILGGGGALALAYHFPLATDDLDAVSKGMTSMELKPYVLAVSEKLSIAKDWLNPYFSSFTHTLPADFNKRLIRVYNGKHLFVDALGKEDILIMKCFAHRPKDVAHSRVLIQQGADVDFVDSHLESLERKSIRGAKEARAFLDDILNQF